MPADSDKSIAMRIVKLKFKFLELLEDVKARQPPVEVKVMKAIDKSLNKAASLMESASQEFTSFIERYIKSIEREIKSLEKGDM